MMESSSNRSNNRIGSGLTNSSSNSRHRSSMPTIFKRSRSAKKQRSLNLNNADFEICYVPEEDEMLPITSNSNTEGSNNTNSSETTTSDDTITDQHHTSQNSCNTSLAALQKSRLISHLKHRLSPCKYETTQKTENDHDKNTGFLLIDQIGADPVLISNDNIDQQHTRHAEPCLHGQIDEESVDINQIQLLSTTPVTPSLLPPQQSSLTSIMSPIIHHSTNELDVQATQAGVECATPNYDDSNAQETQSSATNSSTSTNSSYNDSPLTTNMDRTTLNDDDYIKQQKHDLERITIYEIALNNDRRDYQQDLPQNENDELEFNLRYKDALEQNIKIKEELKRLEDEKTRIHSQWKCEVCTYINEPFIKTRKYVCDMCEGPSPLKRHALTS